MRTIFSVLFFLLVLCACNDSGVSSDVAFSSNANISSETSGESSLSQAVSQSQASEIESSSVAAPIDEKEKYQNELIEKLIEKSVISIKHSKDDYLFFYFVNDELNCRMIRSRYVSGRQVEYNDSDETIKIAILPDDGVFYRAMKQDGRAIELSYDFQRGYVTLTVEKNNYHLNFENGTYTHEIKYRLKDLNLDNPVNTSTDNKLKLYATYLDSGGESGWGDYVILDAETQDIWYLAHFDLYDQSIFCGTDKILIVRRYNIEQYNTIELLDVYTGKSLPYAPKFEYGQSEQYKDYPKYEIVGTAYDDAQKKTLIAYREAGDERVSNKSMFEVYIAVFNEHGNQINTINTGFMMQPYIVVFPNHVAFESVESGTAVISTWVSGDGSEKKVELGSINY